MCRWFILYCPNPCIYSLQNADTDGKYGAKAETTSLTDADESYFSNKVIDGTTLNIHRYNTGTKVGIPRSPFPLRA